MAKPFPKTVKIIIALLVAAGAGWYFFGRSDGQQGQAPQNVAIQVSRVTRQDVPINVKQVGTVVANQTVGVRSRIDSQIVEVKFHDGDTVKEGDVLFVLDDRALVAQRREEQANLVNLKAQYERTQALIEKKYVSQADLDQSRATYEAQQAIVDGLTTQLGYTRITAPIDGRTGTINVTVGNTVKANDTQPLVTINQLKPIRVQLSLPQQYLERVRQSMAAGPVPVVAMHESGTIPSTGTLEYIDNAVDTASGTFAARALFANEDETLWPGMFVTLTMTLGMENNALTIPEVAVQHGQSGDYVFVIENNVAHQREVKIARQQEDMAIVAEGVKEGETIATDGMMSLKEGTPVTINTPEAPAEENTEDSKPAGMP